MKNTIAKQNLPVFHRIDLEQVESKLDKQLHESRQKIQQLLDKGEGYTWDSLMQALESISDELHNFWAPISHLHSVANSQKLREVHHRCVPKLSEFGTELSHNRELYQAIQSIAKGIPYQSFNVSQRKIIDNYIRDFHLSGVDLADDKKKRFSEISKSLSELATKFEENLLDSTHAWSKHIKDERELAGIPTHAIALAKQLAQQQNKSGWIFTLDAPSYLSINMYADSSTLREEMYRMYVTRASDQDLEKKYDNTETMGKMLTYRMELARLLGFKNYAEYSLATKMVKTTKQAMDFLEQLVSASHDKANEEFKTLSEFAKKHLGIKELNSWDISYVAEKLRQHQYKITQEEFRPYFPESQVLKGLFEVVNRLFGVIVKRIYEIDVWHPDVKVYAIYDEKKCLCAYCYIDLYARENKRGGAWMDDHRSRRRLTNGEIQLPIAFLTCNFNPPLNDEPALFSHEDVITLFHEFGHALQHMLTQIDYAEVSGINGIPWDAVELSSQCLENWAWEKESLSMLAKHYRTGEGLPSVLFDRLHRSRNFNTAMQMVRQLEFAIFDMRLHIEFDQEQKNQIQKILDDVRSSVCVIPVPKFNRFQHGFSHIFSGGYAAGYYSYKWAEVMAADAFSLFEERGIFDKQVAKQWMTSILEPGGSVDPADLFIAFRGRSPKIAALLKQQGITLVDESDRVA